MSAIHEVCLPVVERVFRGSRSFVEPSCPSRGSRTQRLAWHAAVVVCDTGKRVRLFREGRRYSFSVDSSSCGSYGYADAWAFLNGVSAGVPMPQEQIEALSRALPAAISFPNSVAVSHSPMPLTVGPDR